MLRAPGGPGDTAPTHSCGHSTMSQEQAQSQPLGLPCQLLPSSCKPGGGHGPAGKTPGRGWEESRCRRQLAVCRSLRWFLVTLVSPASGSGYAMGSGAEHSCVLWCLLRAVTAGAEHPTPQVGTGSGLGAVSGMCLCKHTCAYPCPGDWVGRVPDPPRGAVCRMGVGDSRSARPGMAVILLTLPVGCGKCPGEGPSAGPASALNCGGAQRGGPCGEQRVALAPGACPEGPLSERGCCCPPPESPRRTRRPADDAGSECVCSEDQAAPARG
ncbi:LBH domain-containing protein 2 [Sapajus apella]|uniref:LBH domain-containing protein 2 n=1 Tax=Sapajus apella TaxID=9515 RepID=A0A6J3IKR8_SAPAP|nr:LBH domain-containing protein 2 [Sapajus apella]